MGKVGRPRSSGRLCRSSNHCYSGNVQIIGEASPRSPKGPTVVRRRSQEVTGAVRISPRKKRLYTIDQKVDVLNKYVKWREEGAHHYTSPIPDLRKKYPKMGPNYARELYKKMLRIGTTENQWAPGRPNGYTQETWDEMVRIIREHRERQKKPPGKTIKAELLKVFNSSGVPSVATINRKKNEMKFRTVKVEYVPVINKKKMAERKEFATAELTLLRASSGKHKKWRLTVYIDEKWFTEEKPAKAEVLARADSPLGNAKFKSKSKETKTQLTKIMYLCAVSATHGPIGCHRLDWSHHVRFNSKTGKYEPAKVDSKLLKPLWKKLHKQAKDKFGQSHDIRIVMDKAPAHISKKTKEWVKEAGFDELVLQSPTSPDFSLLDASIFPTLEKECNDCGAVSVAEIEAAVKKVWRKVDIAACKKAAERVAKNMEQSIKLNGGNYYSEGRKRSADVL